MTDTENMRRRHLSETEISEHIKNKILFLLLVSRRPGGDPSEQHAVLTKKYCSVFLNEAKAYLRLKVYKVERKHMAVLNCY